MAKRRYEAITLNGEYFILDTKETVPASRSISRKTIIDCYERPSDYKRNIFADWFNWFIDNNGHCGVKSYNCMMFTIEGYVFDKETNQEYYCYITKSSNKCWKVSA